MPVDPGLRIFDPEALNILAVAQKHAAQQGWEWVDTKHLLLALLDPPGDLVQVTLARLGYPTAEAATAIVTTMPRIEPQRKEAIGLTQATKRIVERAVIEMRLGGATRIDGRHLLLAILADRDTPVIAFLRQHGLGLEGVADELRAVPNQPLPQRWLHTNLRFTIIALACLILCGALVLPFPPLLDGVFLYPLACGLWLLLSTYLDHAVALRDYRYGQRAIRTSGRLQLGPHFSPIVIVNCIIPILLAFIVYHYVLER